MARIASFMPLASTVQMSSAPSASAQALLIVFAWSSGKKLTLTLPSLCCARQSSHRLTSRCSQIDPNKAPHLRGRTRLACPAAGGHSSPLASSTVVDNANGY
jgi:hypothetical protein